MVNPRASITVQNSARGYYGSAARFGFIIRQHFVFAGAARSVF
jgi:hypothetical protein